ncbi:hypothetical protein JCM10213_000235 [Rhodosporidiobolus nylandii]
MSAAASTHPLFPRTARQPTTASAAQPALEPASTEESLESSSGLVLVPVVEFDEGDEAAEEGKDSTLYTAVEISYEEVEVELESDRSISEEMTLEAEDEEADAVEQTQAQAIFDAMDGIFRCHECLTEVVSGTCQGCGQGYEISEEMRRIDIKLDIANESLLQHEDRDWPDPPSPSSSPHYCEEHFFNDLGVPPAMQKRYKVEYCACHGLSVTADAALRKLFDVHPTQTLSFPAADGSGTVAVMQKRPWKIHLGQRVTLHPNDEDGSQFLRDFVTELIDAQDKTNKLAPGDYVTVVSQQEREVPVEASSGDEGAGEEKTTVEIYEEWVTRRVEDGEEFFDDDEADDVDMDLDGLVDDAEPDEPQAEEGNGGEDSEAVMTEGEGQEHEGADTATENEHVKEEEQEETVAATSTSLTHRSHADAGEHTSTRLSSPASSVSSAGGHPVEERQRTRLNRQETLKRMSSEESSEL